MAMILDAFVGKFAVRLMGFIEEKAAMVLGVKEELERLQSKIGWIQNVLEDAERRSLEESAIKLWVNQLKDVMYDADDIIDLCMASSSLRNSHPVSCSSSFFSSFISAPRRYEIGERIKSINVRLEEINKNRLQFNLAPGSTITRVTVVNSRQTSPVLAELDVVGREIEDATEELVKLMTEGEVKKRCRVFAITGMGGIGKTTLAQKIFNHRKVQGMFQIKIWICISQTYSEIELLKQIIRDANGSYGEANTKAELEPLLKSAVLGKSLFLVLDDVWRADVWIDLLRSPLQSAQIDSLILITSRDDTVAKQMGSVYIHHVMHLPVETGWEMLVRRLAMIGEGEEEIRSLREVGIQIIEKCSGLPLAIKVMAGVLAKKEPIAIEWKKVLNNDAWSMRNLPEELRGALYLSYDDLSSPLKQCFLYCSLFPEDSIINCKNLIKLWVAEGFIEDEGDSLMEEKAEEYFHELTRRNLLQLNSHHYQEITNESFYKLYPFGLNAHACQMHDLLRSLAQFISKDESFSENSLNKSIIPLSKLRRVSISDQTASTLDAIAGARSLRTLLVITNFKALNYNQFGRFLHLRVLDLTTNNIEIIPNEIGDLFHLRHLNLDTTHIKKLPKSIGNLFNLQFLSIRRSFSLKKLPQSITRLKNLRCLTLSDMFLDFIPKGIERLKKLNCLEGFFVGAYNRFGHVREEKVIMHNTLEELSSLSNLRILHIHKLERARTDSLVLQKLSKLKDLKLECSHPGYGGWKEKEISLIQELFEKLIPPQSLEVLNIENYFGHGYPKWMMSLSLGSYFQYLSILIMNDISCPLFPPLGQLPLLRLLLIFGADAVKRIGPEFLGNDMTSTKSQARTVFPILQRLEFNHMRSLEEWCFFDENEDNDVLHKLVLLPCLDELKLSGCYKLIALPCELERTTLKRLTVYKSFLKEVGNLPCLVDFDLHQCSSLEKISNLPALKCLTIEDCSALKFVEHLDGLQQLKLTDTSMDCLPEWLSNLTKKRQKGEDTNAEDDFVLHLECNERVLQRCQRGGEDWPVIQQFHRVNAYVKRGKGYLKFVKQPFSYEINIEELSESNRWRLKEIW